MKTITLVCLAVFTLSCTRYAPRALAAYNTQVNAELATDWLRAYDNLPANTPEQQATRLAYRNHLVEAFVWSVDRNYDRFEISFYSGKATEDLVGDFLGLGLGGAAALVNNAHTKTYLALIASTVVGGKASIDARWYDSKTREAVVSQMRALRATQLLAIEQSEKSPTYTLDQAIVDVQAYYQAGTVVAALQEIAESASHQATAAKAALKAMLR